MSRSAKWLSINLKTACISALPLCLLSSSAFLAALAQGSESELRLNIGEGYIYSDDGCTLAFPSDLDVEEFQARVEGICITQYAYPVPGTDVIGRSYLLPPLAPNPRQIRPILPPPADNIGQLRAMLLVDGSASAVDNLIQRYCGTNLTNNDTCSRNVRVSRTDRTYILPNYLFMTTDPQDVGQIAASTQVVSSQQELNSAFNLDASASVSAEGSYGGFSGSFEGSAMHSVARSFSFSNNQQTALRSTSIPLLSVRVQPDLISPNLPNSFNILNFLNEERKSTLESVLPMNEIGENFCDRLQILSTNENFSDSLSQYKEFLNEFGSHVVTRVVLGGEAVVSATEISSNSSDRESTRTAVTTAVEAGYDSLVGSASVSAEGNVDQENNQNSQQSQESTNLRVSGVGGYGETLARLQSFNGEAYADWAGSISAAPSPIRYGYTPIWVFFPETCRQKIQEAYQSLTSSFNSNPGDYIEFKSSYDAYSQDDSITKLEEIESVQISASSPRNSSEDENNALDGNTSSFYHTQSQSEELNWTLDIGEYIGHRFIQIYLGDNDDGRNRTYRYVFMRDGQEILTVIPSPSSNFSSLVAEINLPRGIVWDAMKIVKPGGEGHALVIREVGIYTGQLSM